MEVLRQMSVRYTIVDGILEPWHESADHDRVLVDGQGVEVGLKDPDPLVHDPADDEAWQHVRHCHGGQAQPVGLVLLDPKALEVLQHMVGKMKAY